MLPRGLGIAERSWYSREVLVLPPFCPVVSAAFSCILYVIRASRRLIGFCFGTCTDGCVSAVCQHPVAVRSSEYSAFVMSVYVCEQFPVIC